MRVTVKGKLSIPKEVWSIKAATHRGIAADLLALLANAGDDCPSSMDAALSTLADKHNGLALACDDLAQETKPGRPKVKPKAVIQPPGTNKLWALLQGLQPKKSPGKPRMWSRDFERQTYWVVERRRAEIGASGRAKPTIKNAIDSLNRDIAISINKVVSTYQKKHLHEIRSLYYRGKLIEET